MVHLKGLAQAKIIKKIGDFILFFNLLAAHSPVRLDIVTKFPYFQFLTWLSKNRNFVSISSLTGECAAQKKKKTFAVLVYGRLHHMVILRSQNKITDFLVILAWASPIK